MDLFEEHFKLSERHMAEAKDRIARQGKLIRNLRRNGHDSTFAEELLQSMEGVLTLMEDHHRLILSKRTAKS